MIFASTFSWTMMSEAFLNLYPIYIAMQRAVKTCKFFEMRNSDISTMDILRQNPNINMRMCSGEFLRVHSEEEYKVLWLCINMFYRHCPKYNWVFARKLEYFIPLLREPNILTVTSHTQVIKEILKPSGYWINLGPLQYHWYEFGITPWYRAW